VPATLRWATWLIWAEAAALAVVAALLLYTASAALFAIGYAATMAALLGWLGYALSRLRSWARGPVIVLELLFAPIGYYMILGGLWWLGVPTILAGLTGVGLLLASPSREALSR